MPALSSSFGCEWEAVFCRGWVSRLLVQRKLQRGAEPGIDTRSLLRFAPLLRVVWRCLLAILFVVTLCYDLVRRVLAAVQRQRPAAFFQYVAFLTNLMFVIQNIWVVTLFALQVIAFQRHTSEASLQYAHSVCSSDPVPSRWRCSCKQRFQRVPGSATFQFLWYLESLTIPGALFVTTLYYVGCALAREAPVRDFSTAMKHGVNAAALILDFLLSNMPFYFAQMTWFCCFLMLYQFFLLLIMYGVMHGKAVYSFLDYSKPVIATLMNVCVFLGATIIAMCLVLAKVWQTHELEAGVIAKAYKPRELIELGT